MQSTEQLFGDLLVLTIHSDRLDGTAGAELKAVIADATGRGHGRIVVDLAKVRFMDSTALGSLVSALKLVGRTGELSLASAQSTVSTLFKLTRMDKVFHMHTSINDAVELAQATGT
ncbi:STAS domain-containing protein [soil metagenome]